MVFSMHAAERWFERFGDKDFQITVNGMRTVKAGREKKIMKNNGVTMIVYQDVVATVY